MGKYGNRYELLTRPLLGFCCAYPRLTCRRIGVLNPAVFDAAGKPFDFVQPLIKKYEDRRFTILTQWLEHDTLGCLGCHEHALCPTRLRTFGDEFCLCGSFGDSPVSGAFGWFREVVCSNWEVLWEFGGRHGYRGAWTPSDSYCWNANTGEFDELQVLVASEEDVD